MQQKKSLIILWLVVIFFTACKTNDNGVVIVTDFPIEIEPEIITTHTSPVILAPEEMFIVNNRLWVYQSRKDTIFDVFELPNCNYLYSTGQKGQGPNDFTYPIGNTIQPTDDGFFILDVNVLKFIEPQINGSIKTIYSTKTFDSMPLNGFTQLNDSLSLAFTGCADGSISNYEYKIKNMNTGDVVEIGDYPNLTNKKYENDERCQIYYKDMTVNPRQEKFAAFYTFFKYFRIFTYEGDLEKEIYVQTSPYNSNDLDNLSERVLYYGPPISTDQYIYVPCMGNEIQVWDWDGNPIISYSLTQKFIAFTVSESLNKIYMVSSKEDNENKIFSFDLSHVN